MTTSNQLGTTELLYRCAEQMGLQPAWLTPNGLFAITEPRGEQYINFARSSLNSHVGVSLAKNKHMTRVILERHGLLNIPFTRSRDINTAKLFLAKYKKIIAKPISGSGARDIHVVTDIKQLQDLSIKEYILEQYIAGPEMRYLVLDGKVIGVYQSQYGTSVEAKRSLMCVSYPQDEWDSKIITSSLRVARILDLKFAAVDYIVDESGKAYVLEVNTVPDLKWFHAPTSGPAVDVARLFLEATLVAQPKMPTKTRLYMQ